MTRRDAAIQFRRRGSAATTALLALTTPTALGEVLFQPLGGLPGQPVSSLASGVSADGSVITGFSRFGNTFQAFRWTEAGGMEGLGFLSSTPSYGWGISGDGNVVVGEAWVTGSHPHAFRWSASTEMADINNGGIQSWARGASYDGGVVVGNGTFAEGGRAFRWTPNNGMISIGVLPSYFSSSAQAVSADGSTVVGICVSGPGGSDEAFFWTAETGMIGLGDFPGDAFQSGAQGVSAGGQWVVGSGRSSSGFEAFRWSAEGGMLALGPLPGGALLTSARAVSADGSRIVGYAEVESSTYDVAVIWDDSHGLRRLDAALLEDYGFALPAGWSLIHAASISADGNVIAGHGLNPLGQGEAFRIVIPEPSSVIGLSFVGLLGAGLVRRARVGVWRGPHF